jgi:putative ABC transport system permease protein
MQLLLVMVALLLSIAWANLASLFLARGVQRRRELAVQLALGASRWVILRQRLAESLLVAMGGGAAGVVLGQAGAQMLLSMAPAELPRLSAASPATVVSLAAAGLSLLTALVLGVTVGGRAWRSSALSALETARGASGNPERRRLMSALILTDVAVSAVLMVGAGLLGTSLFRLLSVDAGFDRQGLLTLQVSLSGQRYREDAAAMAFYESMLDRLRALPGVTSAAVVSQLPLGGNFDAWGIHAEDKPRANPAEDPSADRYSISPDYLTAMRIPLRRGRGFEPTDTPATMPVVLVGETLATLVWPGEDAIGKRIRVGGTEGPWRTVVGIVGDVRHTGLDARRTPQVYLPIAQMTDGGVDVVVRTSTPPAGLAQAARAAIAAADPTQAVSRIATMEDVAAVSTGKRRFVSLLSAVFAGLALLLAAVGVAGVVSRSVSDRTREIGIRLVLGALPSAVKRLVLSQVAWLTLAGAALGLAGALALAPLMRHVLFGIAPHDVRTLVWTCLFVIAVPMLAGWLPARRASRLDPVQALHEE